MGAQHVKLLFIFNHLTLQRHLIFSHVWSLVYPYDDDHTALNYYNRESRLNGRRGQTRGMGLRRDRLALTTC
jgi:hypothetical protein